MQNTGVLSATTAFGKTVIASYVIGQRKTNTLILVHTQALMTQWKKSLETFLQFDITPPEEKMGRGRRKAWSLVGVLGAGKDTIHGIVDVAVMQSLVNGDEVKELVRNYGMIIVDECHHVSAVNFEMIPKYANAKYVYGLTATPTRQGGHHPIIFMQCGTIRYRVDAKEQAEKMLDFDFFEVLDSVTIARSRKHIEKYYDTADVGTFPQRLIPLSLYPPLTDLENAINYNEIFEQLMLLNLAIYTPSHYILDSKKNKYAELYDDERVNVGFTQATMFKAKPHVFLPISLLCL